MKKHLLAAMALLALIFALSLPSAGENGTQCDAVPNEYSTVSASKTAHYYTKSGKPQFSFTLYATFGYDGKCVWPIEQSYSYELYSTDCEFISAVDSRYKSEDIVAVDSFALFGHKTLGIRTDTKALPVQLTCDVNGNVK